MGNRPSVGVILLTPVRSFGFLLGKCRLREPAGAQTTWQGSPDLVS